MADADLPAIPGLQLTAKDIHAIGAVVAQWAVAERMISIHVGVLLALTPNPENQGRPVRPGFGEMQRQWKGLLKETLAPHVEYRDIGLRLAIASKLLSNDRDTVAHWPAGRGTDDPDDAGVKFTRISIAAPLGPFPERDFTPQDLYGISDHIHQLTLDVIHFNYACLFDCFPSRCKGYVPGPEGPILHTRQMPTILGISLPQ